MGGFSPHFVGCRSQRLSPIISAYCREQILRNTKICLLQNTSLIILDTSNDVGGKIKNQVGKVRFLMIPSALEMSSNSDFLSKLNTITSFRFYLD